MKKGFTMGAEAAGIWEFDDCTAKDLSGYGNSGIIFGASCVDDTPQKIVGSGQGKKSLSFDGVDDNVVMSGTSIKILYGWTQGTIELWLKPGEFIAGREIWSKNGAADSGLYVNSIGAYQFTLGSSGTGARFFKGIYDEVRIYSQALSIGQIQKLYAEGLENHQNLAIK